MATKPLDALAGSPLFAQLTPRDLRRVARATHEYDYEDGAAVVRQDSPSDSFFVIMDGTAKVTRGGRTVRRMGPGDFFGEIGLLDGGARTASVVAEGPLKVLVLPRREFRQLMTKEPTVAYRILSGAAKRLRQIESPASH